MSGSYPYSHPQSGGPSSGTDNSPNTDMTPVSSHQQTQHHHLSQQNDYDQDQDSAYGHGYNTKSRRTRKKHTNSHYGCKTCKKRKVKCDEGLPVCSNCIRMNLDCAYLTLPEVELNKIKLYHQQQNSTPEVSSSVGMQTPQDSTTGNIKNLASPASSVSSTTFVPNGRPLNKKTKSVKIKLTIYQSEVTSVAKFVEILKYVKEALTDVKQLDFLGFEKLSFATMIFLKKNTNMAFFSKIIFNTFIYFSLSFLTYTLPIQRLVKAKIPGSNLDIMNKRLTSNLNNLITWKLEYFQNVLLSKRRILARYKHLSLGQIEALTWSTLQLMFSLQYQELNLKGYSVFMSGLFAITMSDISNSVKNGMNPNDPLDRQKGQTITIAATSTMDSMKTVLLPAYNPKFFLEMMHKFELFEKCYNTKELDDATIKNKFKLLSNFFNFLQTDLEKSRLIVTNEDKNLHVFNYEPSFTIKTFHNYYGITPYNLTSIGFNQEKTLENQLDVLINLFYLTIAQCITAVIPEMTFITLHEFLSSQRASLFKMGRIDYLYAAVLPIFEGNSNFTYLAKYLIRLASFFQKRFFTVFNNTMIDNPMEKFLNLDLQNQPNFNAKQFIIDARRDLNFVETQIESFDNEYIRIENYPVLLNSLNYNILYNPHMLPHIKLQSNAVQEQLMASLKAMALADQSHIPDRSPSSVSDESPVSFDNENSYSSNSSSNATPSSVSPQTFQQQPSQYGQQHQPHPFQQQQHLQPPPLPPHAFHPQPHHQQQQQADQVPLDLIGFDYGLDLNPQNLEQEQQIPFSDPGSQTTNQLITDAHQLYNDNFMSHDLINHDLNFDSFSDSSSTDVLQLSDLEDNKLQFSTATRETELLPSGFYKDKDVDAFKILEENNKVFLTVSTLQQLKMMEDHPNLLENLFNIRKDILDEYLK